MQIKYSATFSPESIYKLLLTSAASQIIGTWKTTATIPLAFVRTMKTKQFHPRGPGRGAEEGKKHISTTIMMKAALALY